MEKELLLELAAKNISETLFLIIEYLDVKNLSEEKELKLRKNLLKKSIAIFKDQMGNLMEKIQILKEIYPNQIIVEYNDENIFKAFLKASVVETIDSQIYD
jgi:hypothetical protein